jgi:hypothetical protein
MSWGLVIERNDGTVLIDGRHVTLSPVRRGGIRTMISGGFWGGRGPGYGFYHQNVTYGVLMREAYASPITSQSSPIVSFMPRGDAHGCFHSFIHEGGPGNWTGFRVAYQYYMPGWQPAVSKVDPAVFVTGWDYIATDIESAPKSTERWGLRLWGENGNLTFDSGSPVLRINRLLDWAAGPSNTAMRLFTTPWGHPFDGRRGFLASVLGSYLMQYTNFGSAWAAPRVGVIGGKNAFLHAAVGAIDSVDGAASVSLSDYDYLMRSNSNGQPLYTFDVQV